MDQTEMNKSVLRAAVTVIPGRKDADAADRVSYGYHVKMKIGTKDSLSDRALYALKLRDSPTVHFICESGKYVSKEDIFNASLDYALDGRYNDLNSTSFLSFGAYSLVNVVLTEMGVALGTDIAAGVHTAHEQFLREQ